MSHISIKLELKQELTSFGHKQQKHTFCNRAKNTHNSSCIPTHPRMHATREAAAEGGANNGVHHQIAKKELEFLGFGVLLGSLLDVARLQ